MLFLKILTFVFIVGFLIFIHEFAHFFSAKRAKVKVEEFCIGFPPRIFKKKRGETLYSIGAIPVGGFVKIFGEDSREKSKGSFYGKKVGIRAKIVAAGVLSNFILAVILFSIAFKVGYPQAIETDKIPSNTKEINVQITAIAKNSPAEKAGIKPGDKITAIKTAKVVEAPKSIEEVQKFTQENLENKIVLSVKRGSQTLEKEVIPRKIPPSGEGPIGISLSTTAIVEYAWPGAIAQGFKATFIIIRLTFELLYRLIIGPKIPGIEAAGPIGAGGIFVQIADLGFVYIIYFTALLSLNLALINALPFPALDGGRLLFLLIEKIKKAPIKIEIENIVNQVGFALLIVLMVVITFKDIQRLL
jgi:regulator of sigma E protease